MVDYRNGNYSGDGLAGVSRKGQMAIYDTLPRSIRDLIGKAPAPVDVEDAKMFLDQFGEAGACRMIENFLDKKFPGWRQI